MLVTLFMPCPLQNACACMCIVLIISSKTIGGKLENELQRLTKFSSKREVEKTNQAIMRDTHSVAFNSLMA